MKEKSLKSDRLGQSALASGGSQRLDTELGRILDGIPQEQARLSGLASHAEIFKRLELYIKEIELWNPKLGLVEAVGPDLLVRHFFDCLVLVPYMAQNLEEATVGGMEPYLADIGSGAGFPGLVIASAFPNLRLDLVEKQGRRCGFLLNAKSRMGLNHVQVCEQNLEDLAANSYSILTARAFKPLEPQILASMKRVMKIGGTFFLLKGRKEKINEEVEAAGLSGKVGLQIDALTVTDLPEERHLLRFFND